MKKGLFSVFLILSLFFFGSSLFGSQDIPVRRRALSESWLRLLADEVNGYAAFNNLAVISTYHRTLGSDETHDILLRLKKKCEDYGLTSTEILRVPVKTGFEFFGLQNFDGQVPTRVRRAELRLVKPFSKLITTAESAPSSLIQGSRSADLTAPVVFIGRGDDPKNYEGKDVRGKIVLAGDAMPDDVKETAIHRFGAAGVLFYFTLPSNSGDNQDANYDLHWSAWGKNGVPSTFGISLSNNEYGFLRKLIEEGREVVVKVKIDAEIKQGDDAVFETLDAAIPGSEFPEEEFLLWAHIDHALPGAVDNASGCATILEIARTLQALIDHGAVPRPKRTIRFLWLPHVTGLYMYLSRHPEKIGKIRGGLSMDSVGISQSAFSNYFSLSKPSHSLPSYWVAVLEDLAEHLRERTNRNVLDWKNLDNLFAPEGSRDQFNMLVVPYNAGGDEMQSNTNTVGIPTISIGSAPVPPRHSQVNFLSYIDPTGLRRAAYLGAALASVFGWTDGGNVERLVDIVYERGRESLTREAGLALDALAAAGRDEIASVHQKGRDLLRFGLERECAMLNSIKPLVPGDEAAFRLIGRRSQTQKSTVDSFLEQLDEEYRYLCRERGCGPRDILLTAEEKELDRLVPKPVPGMMGTSSYFGDYYEKVLGKERLASFNLKPDFAYGHLGYVEAHNFINGRRSILDIYKATVCELWSEQYPPAHAISLREVADYMNMLEAAKVITLDKKTAGTS